MRLLAAGLLATAVTLGGFTPASATTFPGDFALPQRWNDDYRPETRCGTPGQNGTYVTAHRRWFKQTDATSVANRNDEPVAVTHTVTTARTQTTEVSGKATGKGELATYLTSAFGFSYVYQQHWSVKQVIGPYQVPPHSQGQLVWGFTMLDTDNQDVRCGADQLWHSVDKPYFASSPEARYSELRLQPAPDYGF